MTLARPTPLSPVVILGQARHALAREGRGSSAKLLLRNILSLRRSSRWIPEAARKAARGFEDDVFGWRSWPAHCGRLEERESQCACKQPTVTHRS